MHSNPFRVSLHFAFTPQGLLRHSSPPEIPIENTVGLLPNSISIKEHRKMSTIPCVTFLAVDLRISIVSRWTRALSFPVDHPALRVETADAMLQARIRAYSILAAAFVGLAVVVPMTLQLVAFLTRFSLKSFWTQANCSVIRNATQGVDPARRSIGRAWILALAGDAR